MKEQDEELFEGCCGGGCGCGDDSFLTDENEMMDDLVEIGQEVPDIETKIFHEGKESSVSLSDYRGKWLVLFFYPADFTFVCPTELEELADNYAKFQELGAEILSVSTDTVYTHKAWKDHSQAIGKVSFPMAADTTSELAQAFGVYIWEEGLARRGTFLIDPDGVLQAYEVHSNDIGRSADELLRKLQAAKFVREHGGEVCPAKWKPGEKTLTPGMDLVGKI